MEKYFYKLFRISNCGYVHVTYDCEKDIFEAVKLPPEQSDYEPIFIMNEQ